MIYLSYTYLPHTADIKVEAWGDSLEEAFENAGKGFSDIVVDIRRVSKKIERIIETEGEDLEELLYNFIENLILSLEIDGLIFSEFHVNISKKNERYILTCKCLGEEINPGKHSYKVHVKAITYHEMEIKKEDKKYIIRYIVDI